MKNIQTAESLNDFIEMGKKITNCIEAEYITVCAAKFIGNNTPEFKKSFFVENFSRFSKSECYRILMGELTPDFGQYHYVPKPF